MSSFLEEMLDTQIFALFRRKLSGDAIKSAGIRE